MTQSETSTRPSTLTERHQGIQTKIHPSILTETQGNGRQLNLTQVTFQTTRNTPTGISTRTNTEPNRLIIITINIAIIKRIETEIKNLIMLRIRTVVNIRLANLIGIGIRLKRRNINTRTNTGVKRVTSTEVKTLTVLGNDHTVLNQTGCRFK